MTTTMTPANRLLAADDALAACPHDLRSELRNRALSLAAARHDANGAPLRAPPATPPHSAHAPNPPPPLSTYQTELVTRTAKDQTATSAEDRHDEASTRVLSTNDTSALSAPTASAGEIVEAVNRPTPFGTYQTELVTRTAKDQTDRKSVV